MQKQKHIEIEETTMNEKIMKKIFPEELERIKNKKCSLCNKDINMEDFKDELSKKEFSISGMCQSCQDKIFG